MSQRKRMNRIKKLKCSDGTMCTTPEEDREEVQSFFENLYMSQGFRQMEDLLEYVPSRVTDRMNHELQKPYTAEEVKKALFQMAPSKAPGVDGFTAGFFQRHWELIQDDLVPAILDFVNGGELPPGFNGTSITLIPKVRHPSPLHSTVLYPCAQFPIKLLRR